MTRLRIGSLLNIGTLLSLLPVLYLALAGLQHVDVALGLRRWLVAISAAGLALALALGLGYVGSEALARVGLAPATLRRLMLGMWGFGLVALSLLVTAGHATGGRGLYEALGPAAYALVFAAVVAAELLVVAGMLADRLRVLEAGEAADLAQQLEKARQDHRAAAAERDQMKLAMLEAERDRDEAATALDHERRLRANAEAQIAVHQQALHEERQRATRAVWSLVGAYEYLSAEVDAERLAGAGELLRRAVSSLETDGPQTARAMATALESDAGSVRTALERGVELGLIEKIPAPAEAGAQYLFRRARAPEALSEACAAYSGYAVLEEYHADQQG